MYCSGCGGSIETEAIFCSLCGTRQPLAYALALPQQQIAGATRRYAPTQIPLSYRWGRIHGWVLIFSALFLLRPHPQEKMIFGTIFLVILGICVLRRNRLILPLMAAWPMTQFFLVLAHPVFLVPERLVLPLVFWCLYFVYYYRRRGEFVSWL